MKRSPNGINTSNLHTEFKVRVVLELISGKESLSQASRDYGIKDSVLSRWRQGFHEPAPQVSQGDIKKDVQSRQIAEERVFV